MVLGFTSDVLQDRCDTCYRLRRNSSRDQPAPYGRSCHAEEQPEVADQAVEHYGAEIRG